MSQNTANKKTSKYRTPLSRTLTLLLLVFVSVAANATSLKVGIYQNSPKVYIDSDGKPKGMLVAITEEIAQREGWEIDYILGTWNENIKRLENSEIDVLLDLSYSDDRANRFTLNKIFVIDDWLEIYIPAGTQLKSIKELNHKKVAVLEGSIQEYFFLQELKENLKQTIQTVPFPDYASAVKSLEKGFVDAIITSRFFFLSKDKTENIWSSSIILRPSYTFFAFPKNQNQDIVNAFDKHLMDMKNDSESVYYKAIRHLIKPEPEYNRTKIIKWYLAIGGMVVLITAFFLIVLRIKVKQRTEKLEKRNKEFKDINDRLKKLIANHKVAEQELVKFQFMVENARQEVYLIYPDGKIAYVNKSVTNSLGYTTDELLGQGVELYDPVYKDSYYDYFLILKDREIPAYETIHHTKGGRKRNKIIKAFYLKIGVQEFICEYAEDVTEQKKSEKALVENEMLLHTLTKISPVGIFRTTADGYTTYVNPSWCTLSGLNFEEALGYNWVNAMHVDDRERIAVGWKQATNRGTTYEAEYRFLHPNGKIVWVLVKAVPEMNKNKITSYVGTTTDITKQKRTERLLQQQTEEVRVQSEKYLELIDLATDAFFHGDSAGNLIMINKAACTLTGFSKEELLQKNLANLFTTEELGKNSLRYDLLDQGTILKAERQIKTKEGELVYVEMNSKRMPDGTYQSFFRNITNRKINEKLLQLKNTEYKELNEQLTVARAKAEESDKLKSAFLANMSHEIRTPMNAICGFTQLLGRKTIDDQKRKYYIDIINANNQQLLGIINDIVDISKIESGLATITKSEFNINLMLDNLVQTLIPTTNTPDVALICKKGLPNTQSSIIGDEIKVRQILTNFLVNAIKFTHKGSIKIEYTLNESNMLVFSVKDTGIGIPEESQIKIFERFNQIEETIKDSRKGTGLGLAISKGFAELMGGKIWVESELGKGSTFCFSIPYARSVERKPTINKKAAQEATWSKYTLLLVEDDQNSMLYIKELLLPSQINIIHTNNGDDAIKTCKDSTVDIVLMDIKLPTIDGLETTKRIRLFNKELPIIAQTAYALSADLQKAAKAGCNDYITKPISRAKLLDTMAKYLP